MTNHQSLAPTALENQVAAAATTVDDPPATQRSLDYVSTQHKRASSAAVLRAENLSLTIQQRCVLQRVSVQLYAGQWVAIVGPNGAGKSTLLSVLAGLRQPTVGRVYLQQRPLKQWSSVQRARRIAWLAQQGAVQGELNALDVVRLGRLPHLGLLGSASAEDDAIVLAAMHETASQTFAQRRINELSGGEMQRVLLARALAVQAPLLLLDEPTTHLDPPHQVALLRSVMKRVHCGAAAAVVLHDLSLAFAADRIWLMQQGRLLMDATPDDPGLHQAISEVFEGAVQVRASAQQRGLKYSVQPVL